MYRSKQRERESERAAGKKKGVSSSINYLSKSSITDTQGFLLSVSSIVSLQIVHCTTVPYRTITYTVTNSITTGGKFTPVVVYVICNETIDHGYY
jgi:hypothetical protein